MKEIAKKIILAAIAAKTPCIVRYEDKGVIISPRDGIYENSQALQLSIHNSNRDESLGLRIFNINEEQSDMRWNSVGTVYITWKDIRSISISYDDYGDRYLIKIDGISFNFLEKIKDFEL